MQQAHSDRINLVPLDLVCQCRDFGRIERREDLAARVHALRDFIGVSTLDEGLRSMEPEIERFHPIAAANRVDVAEALRRDQRCARALALEHRVDGDGRAVQNLAECRHIAGGEFE